MDLLSYRPYHPPYSIIQAFLAWWKLLPTAFNPRGCPSTVQAALHVMVLRVRA